MDKSARTPRIGTVRFDPPGRDGRLVELMAFAELRRRASDAMLARPHRGEFFHLLGVTGGAARHTLDFDGHVLRPGDWLLIGPAQVHCFDVVRRWQGWLLVFPEEAIVSALSGHQAAGLREALLRTAGPWHLDAARHATVLRVLRLIRDDAAAGYATEMVNRLHCGTLVGLLQRLVQWQEASGAYQAARVETQRYRRFQVLLEASFLGERRVEHYAGRLGLTEKTLNRACQAVAGKSVKACIRDRLVLEAKRFLAHDDRPVQWIADHLGFSEPTNFTKVFREATGVSPTTFRRRTQGPGGGGPA
ncbi:MAG: helix-turn-helix domain-containing protein [Hyphomicrobiaceae bacterium]